jgi:hypothetical protein
VTTLGPESFTCALCGKVSEQMVISSTSAFGSPDLDLRPPQLQRSTMGCWLQECPHCGYVANDISRAEDEQTIRKVMRSDEWNGAAPEGLSGRFLRCALIEAAMGKLSAAAWSTLHAAWAEDDNGRGQAAASNRRMAATLFRRSLSGAPGESEDTISTMLVLIDALRRSDQWDEALSTCRELEHGQPRERIAAVVRYQKRLIEARDNACHLIGDAEAG